SCFSKTGGRRTMAESGISQLNAAPTRRAQAERHAQQAAEKASERRERQSGAAGWVAERAGGGELSGPDTEFMELQKYFWNPLMGYYFRMGGVGWERGPEAPTLLVGIHAGGP